MKSEIDPARCVAKVRGWRIRGDYDGRGLAYIRTQCSRKCGHGVSGRFCAQHAKKLSNMLMVEVGEL